jgi:hypothetical protein
MTAANCAPTETACLCGPAYAKIAGPCLLGACSGPDLSVAASVGLGKCSAFSATANATGVVTTSGATTVPMTTYTSGTAMVTSAPGGNNSTLSAARTPTTTMASTAAFGGSSSATSSSTSAAGAAATNVAVGVGALMVVLGAVAAL